MTQAVIISIISLIVAIMSSLVSYRSFLAAESSKRSVSLLELFKDIVVTKELYITIRVRFKNQDIEGRPELAACLNLIDAEMRKALSWLRDESTKLSTAEEHRRDLLIFRDQLEQPRSTADGLQHIATIDEIIQKGKDLGLGL